MVSVAATVTRLRAFAKSTPFCTQMRAPVAVMRPKTTIASPPSTGPGYRHDHRPELRREPEHDGGERGDDEHYRRIDLRHRHDADVLGISGDAGAAARAGDDRRDAVAEKRAAEVRIEIAPRHGRDRLHVAQVLRDENDRDGRDQSDRLRIPHRRRESRQADPGAAATLAKSMGLPNPKPFARSA